MITLQVVAYLYPKNYLKLNGFDEKFNMYGEDVDLSIEPQNLGIKCYYISNANYGITCLQVMETLICKDFTK